MSPVTRNPRIVAVGCALLALLVAGCSEKRGAPFDPDAGHPDGFFAQHPAAFSSNAGSCLQCHGGDMLGGISKVSCFSVSRGDQGCHPAGPGGHGAGWPAPTAHGAIAKGTPGPATGFASCSTCHGSDFLGGTARTACSACHGVSAPHPAAPWRGSLTHTTTNPENAPVCALCHTIGAGTPGCFNNTLCHGPAPGHPVGWDNPVQHGTAAKQAPGDMSGLIACEVCHGTGFTGGSSGRSCFPCHGWNAPHGQSGWINGGASHRTTHTLNAAVCAQCHTTGVAGTPGCFNSTLCHGQTGGHPAGWATAAQHGAAAKRAPGVMSGLADCKRCHGSAFTGGSSGQSCFPCHFWNAPHARSGWDGGGSRHRDVNQGNAPVCADCHRHAAGTAGCFNNTLCHGSD